MKYVDIYVIGSSDEDGNGAWAALLRYNRATKLIRGCAAGTNAIRMTMTAIAKGLEALKEPCNVTIYTQMNHISNTYELGWRRRRNLDLWADIDKAAENHTVAYHWYTAIKRVFKGNCSNWKEGMRADNGSENGGEKNTE